ncbi:DUF3304 domain-containing protein [Klebsiella sp. 141240]|uniref:DUF3304 domain-containing protein n=1 Tax=Klebsiella sp. 141240 TaxID=3020034 RepID=UPI00229CC611|nr:DUF3304 domain-containing protein [Klebsiella aerogenes]HCU2335036.1 DUF3304 domain-containing protein [Klebsiella aerogenes]
MSRIKWIIRGIALFVSVLLSGCSPLQADESDTTAITVGAYNHVAGQRINWFAVNGYRVPGLGGGYCCVTLPDQWRPEMVARIEWEVDPNSYARLPPLGTDAYNKAYIQHKANYLHYSVDVEIPQYNHLGEFSVHILPCQKVEIYTGVEGPNSPSYPIKEPMNMQEPATCQK